MRMQRAILAGFLVMVMSLGAAAGEIYMRVNEEGVTEYSDTPFPGATAVRVRPNVVTTNPLPPRQRNSGADSGADSEPQADARQPARVQADDNTVYEDADERAQRDLREQRRTRNPKQDELAADTDPGRALRNAARNTPVPAPRTR